MAIESIGVVGAGAMGSGIAQVIAEAGVAVTLSDVDTRSLERGLAGITARWGITPNLTLNPAESIQTMTAFIVQISKGDTPAGTTPYYTLFAVGMTLFVMTLIMNAASQWFVRRFRLQYN